MKVRYLFLINVILVILVIVNPKLKVDKNVKIGLVFSMVILSLSTAKEGFNSMPLSFNSKYNYGHFDSQFQNFIKYKNNNPCWSWDNLKVDSTGKKYDRICNEEPIDRKLAEKMDLQFPGSSSETAFTPDVDANYPNSSGDYNNPYGSRFMFNYNKYSPECCPSIYSSDSGCICLTDKQKKYLYSRAGNKGSYN